MHYNILTVTGKVWKACIHRHTYYAFSWSGLLLMERANTDLLCLQTFFFFSGNGGCGCCVYNFVHAKGMGLNQSYSALAFHTNTQAHTRTLCDPSATGREWHGLSLVKKSSLIRQGKECVGGRYSSDSHYLTSQRC